MLMWVVIGAVVDEQGSTHTWSCVRWQAGFPCLLWSHLWSTLERNSANAGVNVFSWGCGSGMGSESKERGLWTWNMEEVSGQGFCKVIAREAGIMEGELCVEQ